MGIRSISRRDQTERRRSRGRPGGTRAVGLEVLLQIAQRLRLRRQTDRLLKPGDGADEVAALAPGDVFRLAGGLFTLDAGGGASLRNDPNRIFVGGLPLNLEEPQIRELLASFGEIRALDLICDRETGRSKGCVRACGVDGLIGRWACFWCLGARV